MDGTPAQPRFSPPQKLLVVLVLAITCAAFIPSLSNGFVNWDDNQFVYDNPNVLSLDWTHLKAIFTKPVTGGYCPLVILSFALEKLAFGLNPGVFHLDNLLLHLVCVFLVYRLLQKLQLTAPAAAFGALLFGVHPMHVESVAWITERKDVLYSAFYFAALLAYVAYVPDRSKKLYAMALVLFALALLAKIQAVALPLSMLLLDYYFKRPAPRKLLLEKLPFFALAIAAGCLGIWMLSKTGTLNALGQATILDRLLIGSYAFWVYIIKAVVPYQMWPVYTPPPVNAWPVYAAAVASIASVWCIWREHKRGNRAIVFGFLFFAANIVFVLQILSAGATFLSDRYTYVAYFGLFYLAAKAFDFAKRRALTLTGAAIYICALGILTWHQCSIWENGETLWTFTMRHMPNSPLPYLQRAYFYRSEAETAPTENRGGLYSKALTDYDRAVELVDAKPDAKTEKAMAHNSRAKTLFDAGQTEPAIADYTKVIALDPTYADAYVNRGAAYAKSGRRELALSDLNQALSLQPNNLGALFTRGLVYKEMHRLELALRDFNEYLAMVPNDSDILLARGTVERELGKPTEAIRDFDRALQVDPDRFAVYSERSRAFLMLGKTNEALRDANLAKEHGESVAPIQ